MRYFALVLLAVILTLPQFVTAQFLPTSGSSISLATNPQYPAPDEVIEVTLDDYSLNASGANIEWFINGEVASSAKNKRITSITAPKAGSSISITALVRLTNGQTYTAEKIITPRYLDVVIEPLTYSPQFYQGRALPSFGSTVKAVALLHEGISLVDSTNFTYTWRLNNNVLEGGPLRGGNIITYTVPHGSTHVLSVEISNRNNEIISKKLISIPSEEVDLHLYEIKPLSGLIYHSLRKPVSFTGNNLTLRAVPYNLDLGAASRNSLFTEWTVNSQKTKANSGDPFELTINRTGFGSASVGFKVRNLDALIQGDETSLMLQF